MDNSGWSGGRSGWRDLTQAEWERLTICDQFRLSGRCRLSANTEARQFRGCACASLAFFNAEK